MADFPKAMIFIDGSNLLIEMFKQMGMLNLRADKPSQAALHLAYYIFTSQAERALSYRAHIVARRYWFGSIQGDEDALETASATLREVSCEAVLFRKRKGRDEKGVDLAIAREMLIHAFNKNYESAVLIAGDEDYLGLVQDLKRLGVHVTGAFFKSEALSPRLKNSFDAFTPLELITSHPGLVASLRSEVGAAASAKAARVRAEDGAP